MSHMYADTVIHYRPIEQLLPDEWVSDTVNLSDGGTVHYLRTNQDKQPILLIHGFQVDSRMWLRTALALRDKYDLIMPDVRGHGLSSAMPLDLIEETLSDDMVELVNSLNLQQKPIIVGHSMGADIALRLAGKIPVEKIILVDPALKNLMKMMPPIGDTLPDYILPVVETMQKLSTLEHSKRMQVGLNLLPPGTKLWNESDYVSFVEGQSRFDVESYKRAKAMGYIVDSPEVIAKVDYPILLLTAKSMMLPPDEFQVGVAIFKDNWQTGEHIHLEDSGHFIPFDQFEKFMALISD